jgi:hypothetical protein
LLSELPKHLGEIPGEIFAVWFCASRACDFLEEFVMFMQDYLRVHVVELRWFNS